MSTIALVSACGSGSGSSASATGVDSVSAPSDSAVESVISNYAPIGFTDDDGNLVGLDPELGAALGTEMGIDLTVKEDAFENSMTGLASGRVQMVPGASITEERLKTMDFVPYYKDSYRVAVLPDADDIGDSMADLCGLTLGYVTGDATIPTVEDYSDSNCGSNPVKISTYTDGANIQTAVQAGRVDAWVCALSACGYQAAEDPDTWKVTGPSFATTTIGIAVKKDSGWAEVIAPALKALIADGTYESILEEYGIEDGALSESDITVNPTPDE